MIWKNTPSTLEGAFMLTKDAIRQLNDRLSTPALSLYLHVDPGYQQNQAETPAWRIWLKTALRDLEQAEEEGRDETRAEQWGAIRQQLDNWMDSYRPAGKTLVFFADVDQQFTYELPVALQNRASFGKPNLTPALWAIDEYERYLIVLVDQEQAKFMSAYLGNSSTEDTMTIDLDLDWGEKTLMPATPRGDSAIREGSNRERFEDMIGAHIDRFHQDVADHIRELLQDLGANRLVIGGAERAAHNVRSKLHETIEKALVTVLPIPMASSDKDIRQSVLQAGLEYERNYESEIVNQVIDFAKADGRGALGNEAVDRAFTMQQVELLLLPYPPEDDEEAARLTRKALENNSHIELIHGDPAARLREEGGVAARLYYSINET